MPKPIKYKHGYRVNFSYQDQRHRQKFRNTKYLNPYQSALDYIDRITTGKIKSLILIDRLVDSYFQWAENTGQKKLTTIKTQRSRLNRLVEFLRSQNITYIHQIDISGMRSFQEYFYDNYPFSNKNLMDGREGKRRRHMTWDKYRLNASAFFNYCVDRDYMIVNPIFRRKEFKPKTQSYTPRWFHDAELQQIFNYFDDAGGLAPVWFRTLAYTGMRLSEALNLEWSAINLENRIIRVQTNTKNYQNRSLPIHIRLLPYLMAIHNDNHYVFSNGNGGRYCTGNAWYKRLQTALKQLGLQQTGLHAFRHSFGSALARSGAHPKEIQELLGHADIKMAMWYVHYFHSDLKNSVNRLSF